MTTTPTTRTDAAAFLRALAVAAVGLAWGASAQLVGSVADDQVYVRRYADTVVVRRAADGTERTLYSHDGARFLGVGDEVEQGSSGRSDWVLPGGGTVSMGSSGHGIIAGLGGKRDRLTFPHATQLSVTSQGRPLVVLLAGTVRAAFEGTTLKVTYDAGVYTVRNEGGQPILITGDLSHRRQATAPISAAPDPRVAPTDPPGSVTLGVGEELRVAARRTDPRGPQVELWGAIPVWHSGTVALEPGDDALVVRAEGPLPGDASVGGVRLVASPRDALVVRRRRPRPAGAAGAEEAPPTTDTLDSENGP